MLVILSDLGANFFHLVNKSSMESVFFLELDCWLRSLYPISEYSIPAPNSSYPIMQVLRCSRYGSSDWISDSHIGQLN